MSDEGRYVLIFMLLAGSVGCRTCQTMALSSDISKSQPITIEDFSMLTFSDPEGNEVKLADIMTKDYLPCDYPWLVWRSVFTAYRRLHGGLAGLAIGHTMLNLR